MSDRRTFLQTIALGAFLGTRLSGRALADEGGSRALSVRPVTVSTWRHGLAANTKAWKTLASGGRALDAVEAGVRVSEADPELSTVGIGGYPDRSGKVTLDASIMDESGRCGSVAYLQHIKHPVSVARRVMETTPHVMLVGQGALEFALANGFKRQNLLTEKAAAAWNKWREKQVSPPPIGEANHDTIGMLTLDAAGNLSGACTTSGAAFKYEGRVGDSPIIGAGLYVDNEVGGATSSGWGEAVIRAVGSFLVVEFMRQGHAPTAACELAVERVIQKNPDWRDIQVGFLALNKNGEHGSFSIAPGFSYALRSLEVDNQLVEGASRL